MALAGLHSPGLRVITADDAAVALRLLADRRDELGVARTQTINRLHRLLLELLPGGAKKFLSAAQAKDRLRRSVRQTILDQVWITTSGFFTMVPFMAALMSFGVDRIMFSVDYPFAANARARAFLDALPVSPADRAKIAHGNADRLLRLPG